MEEDYNRQIDKVRKDYNSISKEWDFSRSRPSNVKISLLDDMKSDSEVLDIGCGNGVMLPFVLDKESFYVGLDISEELIDIAKDRYNKEISNQKAKFFVGDATNLPFLEEEFDFIISFAVLHHIPFQEMRQKYFNEIKRVLRPGGRVKITVWNLFNSWAKSRFDVENQLSGKKSGDLTVPWKGTPGMIVNRYVHQFSVEELELLIKEAGFDDFNIDFRNRAGEIVDNGEEIVLQIRS